MTEPTRRLRPVLRPTQDGVPASPPSGPEAQREAAEASVRELLARARLAGPGGFPVEDLPELVALWPPTERGSLPRLVRVLVELARELARSPEPWARFLLAGRGAPAVADVVAGLPGDLTPTGLVRVSHELVRRALAVDFGDGLQRAAGILRVAAAGRRELAAPGSAGEPLRTRADADLALALECEDGASAHRRGALD